MPPRTERARRVARAALVALSGAQLGCVSTETGEGQRSALCAAAPLDVASAGGAVVSIRASVEPGVVGCSGVAIAPTLVVTALGCVVRPAGVGDPEPSAPQLRLRQPPLYVGGVRYAEDCERGSAWSAREDGSFAAHLGKRIAPEAIAVFERGDERPNAATEVITSRAASRCADGIAVLRLERELGVRPASLRLDDVSSLDEAVQISGHCIARGAPDRRDLTTHIAALTFEAGSEVAPPRSLWSPATVSSLDLGGAVLSAASGALIGVVASGLEPQCETADPAAGSVAIRLAPFRRMLFDAASARGIVLRVASGEGGAEVLPACVGE